MSFSKINAYLTSALVAAGTFAVNYPSGKNKGSFYLGTSHKIVTPTNDVYSSDSGHFSVALGDTSATITWNASTSIPAGTLLNVQLEEPGRRAYRDPDTRNLLLNATMVEPMLINLGNPIAPSATALISAATGTELPDVAAPGETVTYTPSTAGTSPVDGANSTWVLDVARNVVVTVTHASSIVATNVTVRGTDMYGNVISELLAITATGTNKTAAGKKAFKSVTSIAIQAAADSSANTVNVGFGDVLGLPVFLPSAAHVLKEIEDAAAATAGTFVAGDQTKATTTTGDVRGTYDPSSACNGTKVFKLIVALPDPGFLGVNGA